MAIALAACGGDEAPAAQIIEVPGETIIVEKEVIVEVPVEVVVEKEVIKEVKVPGETIIVEKVVEVMAPQTFGEEGSVSRHCWRSSCWPESFHRWSSGCLMSRW